MIQGNSFSTGQYAALDAYSKDVQDAMKSYSDGYKATSEITLGRACS